jgi:hypothetical protein
VTLRQALGGDTERLHELLEELLDTEDVVVLLFDGDRAVNYSNGFGLSPSQHELMALAIERIVRAAGATRPTGRGKGNRREKGHDSGSDARIRERLGGAEGRPDGSVVDGRRPSGRSGDAIHSDRGLVPRPVLQLARTLDASCSD